METVEVVKVYGQTVWVESDFFGSKHVMLQSEAPGTEPFCYCSFHYGYGYTDNRSVHEAAQRMAISLGAVEPVEFRQRELKVPNVEVRGGRSAKRGGYQPAQLVGRPSRPQGWTMAFAMSTAAAHHGAKRQIYPEAF